MGSWREWLATRFPQKDLLSHELILKPPINDQLDGKASTQWTMESKRKSFQKASTFQPKHIVRALSSVATVSFVPVHPLQPLMLQCIATRWPLRYCMCTRSHCLNYLLYTRRSGVGYFIYGHAVFKKCCGVSEAKGSPYRGLNDGHQATLQRRIVYSC